ncbi:MAG: addiction module protein [Chitinivibrionales bacterium]|nr:addiction module protein [Chitinivibrionales bacterium]
MNQKAETIISDAMLMPDEDRAIIAERLIASLDHEFEKDAELAWQKEIQKRIEDIDSGKVTCIPWEQVRSRLQKNCNV